MAKIGRPTDYNQDIVDKICERLREGISLRTICIPEDMPSASTVFGWLRRNDEFVKQYTRAKEEGIEAMAEDILDIADDGTNDWMEIKRGNETISVPNNEVLQRSKLRVDTRKWIMSKLKSKKYGDKVDMTTNGKDLPTPIYGGNSTK